MWLYTSCKPHKNIQRCIRCERNRECEFSRIADGGNSYTTETPKKPETSVLLIMDETRSRRVALLSDGVAETEAEGSHDSNVADETSYPRLTNDGNCNRDEGSVEPDYPCPSSSRDIPERIFTVHRGSCPFRKRSMPFSRHLENFLTINKFSVLN